MGLIITLIRCLSIGIRLVAIFLIILFNSKKICALNSFCKNILLVSKILSITSIIAFISNIL
ncbi:MAG: hypothetical protein ACI8VJ_000048 [Polaribacter sp.]|jgi:hypothetical protein